MAEFIYQMYQARKAHGDKVILDDVTLSFYPGAKIGVVGPNGMGKSTLLKIMAGIEEVSNGDAKLTPGYTVGILQQEPPLDDDKTVIENVRMAFGDMIAKVDRFNKIGEEMCDPDCDMDALMAEMGKLQDEIDAADGWDIDSKLGQAMDALQLPDSDMPVNVLSGGERRRVALCKLLLEAPDLLLLDEPTNHLDAESILWLEHFLHNYQGAVLAVTHDRYFLDNVAEWICEVDRGHLYPYKGNYSTYLETKAARIEAQGNRDAKLAKRMEAELEVGETVKISYVDQNRSGIDPDKNLWEVVSDGLDHMMVGETEVPSRAYVASFGFKGQDQQKRAGVLSGGERNRLNLALTLKQGGNLLLLDEPTNDLDVETLSSLEAALLEFPGCSVVISHDRMFLDRVATHILAWEGTDENPGNWYWFEGNFEAYQANRIERLGEDAAQPHRIHRKLTRD